MATMPHVLIAEDNDEVRALLARVVARTYPSVTISAVADGADALALYLARGADLLITNNDMPIMSGIVLVQTLRAQQASIPILMISSDAVIQPAAMAAGATRFLLKPFVLADLAQALLLLLPR